MKPNDEAPVSSRSWRPQFNAFIQDGKKRKISSLAVKSFAVLSSLMVFGYQIIAGFGPEKINVGPSQIPVPKISFEEIKNYVPEVYNERKFQAQERRKVSLKRQAPRIFEPIKPVNLISFKDVPTGTEAQAILSSGGSNGTVIAKLQESVQANGETLFEKDSILYGVGRSNADRLYLTFDKIIRNDKSESSIFAQAFDKKDRLLGLKGKKISDYAFRLAASSGLIFLGGLADSLREDEGSALRPQRKTVKDAALNGIATAAIEQGREVMESMKAQPSRVEVKAKTPIVVIFGDSDNERK